MAMTKSNLPQSGLNEPAPVRTGRGFCCECTHWDWAKFRCYVVVKFSGYNEAKPLFGCDEYETDLYALGYDDVSEDDQRKNLATTAAMKEWPR